MARPKKTQEPEIEIAPQPVEAQPQNPNEVRQYVVCGRNSFVKTTDVDGNVIKGGGKVGFGGLVYLTAERAAQLNGVVCLPEAFAAAGNLAPAALVESLKAENDQLKAEIAELKAMIG